MAKNAPHLLLRSAVLAAVPALVLLARQATDSYWLNLLVWLLGVTLAGYAAWPLSRHALAATSPHQPAPPSADDWWARDGFVRASMVFYITVAVGVVFLVVPGVMVIMIYCLYPFFIVDRKARGIRALAYSSEMSRGNRIRLLGLQLVLLTAFAPGVASLYLWNTGPGSVIAFWVLITPALAAAFTIIAAGYRALTGQIGP